MYQANFVNTWANSSLLFRRPITRVLRSDDISTPWPIQVHKKMFYSNGQSFSLILVWDSIISLNHWMV